MRISILKDFKIFDAGSKHKVEEIVNKIALTSSDVTLDISKCIIDYPATSAIIDKILLDLSNMEAPRLLTIQTHLNILEILLLHWLFIGSEFFKIDNSHKKNNVDEFKSILKERLAETNTTLKIQIVDKNEKIIKEYSYGHK